VKKIPAMKAVMY